MEQQDDTVEQRAWWKRRATRVGATAILALAVLVLLRRGVLVLVLSLFPLNPQMASPTEEVAPTRWFDDYFTVTEIDPATFAIGEPRYWQANHSYLICGADRAILFDSGPGERNIRDVVESLTPLPVIVAASHLHYDHVGNHERFERGAMLDLPELRKRVSDGVFTPSRLQHLGAAERKPAPAIPVSEWWAPGEPVDLGGRALQVLHTPGHTPESMALYDAERRQLFIGDFIYPGPLFAWVPGADLDAYRDTAERLTALLPEDVAVFAAHRETPPGLPLLRRRDIVALRDTLRAIDAGTADGTGLLLRHYRVNDRITLEVDLPGVPSLF